MKNTTKHTPGPWHIGMKPGPIIYGPSGEQVACLFPAMLDNQENKANARLIAAAPALLEALQETLRVLVTPQGFPDKNKGRTQEQQDAFDQSRQAIAQATGEQP
jgi:hypothetical protein